jgi:vitamin B12 transporter
MIIRFLIFLFLFLFAQSLRLFSDEIPVIVISAGKTVQSYSSVGSQVTIIDSYTIENSSETFLNDLLDSQSQGLNIFQVGGVGTNAGIQMRGLPKRYSTVYIDGVKMSDPSASDNGFYSQGLFKNSIDRIEILKGIQSSLYGNSAVGGTINIFTKKGRLGKHINAKVATNNNNTKDVYYSIDGANEKQNYYIGLNYYKTDGISAMNNDNSENDGYENNSLLVNYGYKITDNTSIENSLTLKDSFLNYDEPTNGRDDTMPSTDDTEGHYNLKIINTKNNFKNTFGLSKSYTGRRVTTYAGKESTYEGYRDMFTYLGEYNLNFDNKLIYGTDIEFVAADFPSDPGVKFKSDEEIYSQYIDYQFRPYENIYATIGVRNDKHTTAGDEQSYRVTTSYKLDGKSKIRASYGTGFIFPTLYEGHNYEWTNTAVKESVVAEKSTSFDIGYETFIESLNLFFNITYFDIEIEDPIVGWTFEQENGKGKNTSRGIELATSWNNSKNLNIDFTYTATDSYSGMDCDDPAKDAFGYVKCIDSNNGIIDSAMVRVPLHAISTKLNYKFNKNLNTSLLLKYRGQTRDYGGSDQNFKDQYLDEYLLVDLLSSYNLSKGYKINFSVKNIFDKDYENSFKYTGPPRTINIGLKKSF